MKWIQDFCKTILLLTAVFLTAKLIIETINYSIQSEKTEEEN